MTIAPAAYDARPRRLKEPQRLRAVLRSRPVRRLLKNKPACVALGYLLMLVLLASLAHVIRPYDPTVQNIGARFESPSPAHWLGTDQFGRDILSRLLYGAQITLIAAGESVGLAALIGIPAGLLAGYLGGWLNAVTNAMSDTAQSLPPLILALVVIGFRGPGLTNAMLAIGIILSPRFFRVARSVSGTLRNETFVEASRSIGCPNTRILRRHLLPNASGPLLIQVTFSIGVAVTAEASLSFLGLGVQAPQASWGTMINESFSYLSIDIWPIIPPSVLLAVTILACAVLGDGIRDALGRESAAS